MKKNLFVIFAVSVLLTVVLGCSVFNKIREEVVKSQTPQTLTATDGSCQITVGGDWRVEPELNKEAVVQAAKLTSELYVVVIREDKTDFGDEASLEYFTELVHGNYKETISQSVISDALPANINGFQAKQFEVSGEIDKIKLKYLIATVETPESYYQIITWTLASRYESNKDALQAVIYSFKEPVRQTESAPAFPPNTNKNSSK